MGRRIWYFWPGRISGKRNCLALKRLVNSLEAFKIGDYITILLARFSRIGPLGVYSQGLGKRRSSPKIGVAQFN